MKAASDAIELELCSSWWLGILPKAYSCVSQYRLFEKYKYAVSLKVFVYATCTEYNMLQGLAGNGVKRHWSASLWCVSVSFLELCCVH